MGMNGALVIGFQSMRTVSGRTKSAAADLDHVRWIAPGVRSHLSTGGDCVISLRRRALGKKSEFYAGEFEPIPQPSTIRGWEVDMLSKIARKIHWTATQCAMLAVVAVATNLLASAGALTSHSSVVTQPKQITMVDRSRKGDRLTPAAAPSIKIALPRGCEASVSSLSKVPRPSLLWRCVT